MTDKNQSKVSQKIKAKGTDILTANQKIKAKGGPLKASPTDLAKHATENQKLSTKRGVAKESAERENIKKTTEKEGKAKRNIARGSAERGSTRKAATEGSNTRGGITKELATDGGNTKGGIARGSIKEEGARGPTEGNSTKEEDAKSNRDDQPKKLDLASMSIAEDQRRKLKQIFPEVFNENKVDWKKLKATLGKDLENHLDPKIEAGGQWLELYDKLWPGKYNCFRIIQQASLGTLKPRKKESLDWDRTQNLFIEGDNLEVLKLLQRSYYNKVKMIYIDPPYNTGKDFIYPDKFSESLETYLKYTGQKDSKGKKFSTNQETDGRFHSNWLNMMYPRLFLARNLLKDDGVIFISIDDNEVANLRNICDDIFGEENFINIISAKMKNIAGASGGGEDKRLKKNIEFVLVYSKYYNELKKFNSIYKLTEIYNLIKYYEFNNISWKYTSVLVDPGKEKYLTVAKDGDGNEIKIFERINPIIKSVQSLAKQEKISQKEIYYKYIDKIFTTAMPQSSIRVRVANSIDALKASSELYSIKYIPKTGKNKGKIYEQFYKGEKKRLLTWLKDVTEKKQNKIYKRDLLGTLWDDLNLNNLTKEGDIKFENGKKPLKLLENIVSMVTEKDSIILDFFAGSGTTAHAVYEKNLEDGGNRKYICVQLPEPTQEKTEAHKAGFKTIADIGKERIRRAVKKIKAENTQKSLLEPDKNNLDLGFRVFKLDRSNFRRWDDPVLENKAHLLAKKARFEKDKKLPKALKASSLYQKDPHQMQMRLQLKKSIDPSSSDEDLLYEILIKTGFQLTTPIEILKLANKKVYSVEKDALLICLERKISKELIFEIAKLQPARVVCLDKGFENEDWLKTNAKDTFDSFRVRDFRVI